MTTLLVMSFMLHIITLLAIYLLYSHIKTFKKDKPHEVLELLDVYLEEIKLENENLREQLNQGYSNTEHRTDQVKQTTQRPVKPQDSQHGADTLASDISDTYEHSLHSEILHMHHEGYHADEIARHLNCGKTEADLVIKMQNDQHK
ncbi:hypothetical protein JNUCC1_03817 [Lentibacillus sp. JNUCC-1]|uniref:DUF6115 domain-containing protein n=1 Tax=Lentibacillus sp. JNUCC-1 TaxID=2654513 RepID=UPI0012E7FD08|nr:hypothetical protein [Lentibacillus sp. JNUCC-1]MUV39933.1 hypothetical protein [Lentibacillus sp. JNUCC-1]